LPGDLIFLVIKDHGKMELKYGMIKYSYWNPRRVPGQKQVNFPGLWLMVLLLRIKVVCYALVEGMQSRTTMMFLYFLIVLEK